MEEQESEKLACVLRDLDAGEIGKKKATDRLFNLVFSDLHEMAQRLMHDERPNHTLQATALINEVYLKLIRGDTPAWESRGHFFGVASRAMRQILVDHARGRNSAKRGGDWKRVTLNDELGLGSALHEQVIDLDAALTRLSIDGPRMALVAELIIFCGLKTGEISEILDLSLRTVQNDWRVARMWLVRELEAGAPS